MPRKEKRNDKLLSDSYFDPALPESYGGEGKLAKKVRGKIPRNEVSSWLAKTDTYTLHKPVRRKFPRRQYIVSGLNQLWQIDLSVLPQLSRYNDGYKYILFCIDVFSKYAMARPVKNKTGSEITAQFEDIIKKEKRKPSQVNSDKGGEFYNSVFQKMLKHHGIKHYTTENQEIKAAVVERLQRTIKSKMFRYFTHTNAYRWIDALQEIMSSYNQSHHSSINMRPVDVTYENQETVWLTLHDTDSLNNEINYKFQTGDKVRVSKYSTVFQKGYLPLWTQEIFTIAERHSTKPPTYSLRDDEGQQLKGTWYEPELQKVTVRENIYKIESILGQRKVNGKTQYLVRWAGYPSSYDSYVDKKDMNHEYKN
jgi:hypothetical protein